MTFPPGVPRPEGLRWQLRAATQSLHAEVDRVAGRYILTDRAGYRDFLLFHARAMPGLEQGCAAALGAEWPGWAARHRSPALAADLALLGSAMPAALPAPPLGREAALGAAYVLEGSRLGNAMLLRQVLAGGDAVSQRATAYLSHRPEGEATGWPGFLARLEAALPDPALWPAAAEGACLAFHHVLAALRQGQAAEPAHAV
ncbi:biliverdin-producing heme oxygenase [Teichococcus cervicalis]|uniref:Heme oxygenase n=1 Tax=Pseudoroseomonas cervicalis ATCC 49957 TaxID=525371 RepID=D5RIE5_9PROT|nr:biliverdin-producing heme oxygenase [Pseudoroseomonas cervicalis]EFH12922.1 heme oxygenase [Pseudoroseomonas cervicalis ATCC 49957]